MAKPIKITFSLDESDSAYFRNLYRSAKKHASPDDAPKIIAEVQGLVERVRATEKVPNFVEEAIVTLEDLIQMLEDEDYGVPKAQKAAATAALAYFANPEDVIPDHIPALGFLDDAIMIKFVEDEFRHELWAYRKFRTFRDGAEQRPWSAVAKDRLPKRLNEYRLSLREKVTEKKQKDAAKENAQAAKKSAARAGGRSSGW